MDLRIIYKFGDDIIAYAYHKDCGNTMSALFTVYNIVSAIATVPNIFKANAMGNLFDIYLNFPFTYVDVTLVDDFTSGAYGDIVKEKLRDKKTTKVAGVLFKADKCENIYEYSGTYITVDLYSLKIDISGVLMQVPVDSVERVRSTCTVYDIDEEYHGPILRFIELDTYIDILDTMGNKFFNYDGRIMMLHR